MPNMNKKEIIIALSHAAVNIPPDIRSLMPHSDHILLREPDLYTDRIFAISGVTTVLARHSRIIGDCNRAPDELYTEGKLRAESVVMLSLSTGQDVFANDPSLPTMQEWIRRFHKPFHDELNVAMRGAHFLIDAHSLASVGAPSHSDPGGVRADIILGNRQYSSCSAETMQFFRAFFEERGLSVVINIPYAGRYILGTYANRFRTPGIQIEINRKLYMDEQSLEPYEMEITKFNVMMNELMDAFCIWDEANPVRQMIDLSEHESG